MARLKSVVEIGDFVVMRRRPETRAMKAAVAARDKANSRFLRQFVSPPAGGELSGSFIYAHPPDYRGRPMHHADAAEWRVLFQELKEIGINLVILQAAAWVDFRECYYPSKLFKEFKTWNILEPLLEAAAQERMTVYLGCAGVLFNDIDFGVTGKNPAQAKAGAKREIACYKELLDRYRGRFNGYYLSPETGFPAVPDKYHLKCFHTFFERATNEVKNLAPRMPILTSPWTTYAPGREEEAVEYLSRLHANCPIDAFAPQDSIGTFNRLPSLESGLKIWRAICRNLGAEFWVNCESFSIANFGGPVCDIVPAEPKRFAVQLAAAAKLGAKRIVTWEAGYFMARKGSAAARRLRRNYLARAGR